MIANRLSTTQLIVKLIIDIGVQTAVAFCALACLKYRIYLMAVIFGFTTLSTTYGLYKDLDNWRTPK
jgi:hypothetical protein